MEIAIGILAGFSLGLCFIVWRLEYENRRLKQFKAAVLTFFNSHGTITFDDEKGWVSVVEYTDKVRPLKRPVKGGK